LSDLLEQLVHGLTLGSLYAMVATGLALMFGVVRLINFAHGEFYMLGGYAFWYAYVELGLPYPVAGLAAVAAMAVFGLAYERAVIRTILARTWHVQLIATLATSITLTNLAIIVFGTQPKEVPTRLSAAILDVGGVRMAWQRVLVLVAAVAIFAALEWFVAHARLGKAMRAMSQNREACAVVGVDVQQVALATFGISAGLAAAAAALVSPLFSIFPDVGALLTLKAFAAVIVGGFGYVRGAIAAAFLIGIAEALAAGYLSYARASARRDRVRGHGGGAAGTAAGTFRPADRDLMVRAIRWVLGSAALVAVPWIAAAVVPGQQRYVLHVLIFTALYGALALSYDLVVCHVGSLSLAHPAFFGLGAYTLALLATEARWPFAFALPAGIALAAVVALAVGVPMFRLTEHSFAMGTLGFAIVTQVVATNWVDFTHGPLCVTGIPKPQVGALRIATLPAFYWMGLGAPALVALPIAGSLTLRLGGPSTRCGTTRSSPPPRRSIRSGTACSPS
jgi:branched-subunit amino acid ABC-type transport system permease component